MIIQNIEEKKQSFIKYWNKENETPLVSIKAYQDKQGFHEYIKSLETDKRYRDPFSFKADPSIMIDHQVNKYKHMYFPAETLPIITTAIGPGICSAFLGAVVDLTTVDEPTWFHENLEDWDHARLDFDERNAWWNIQKLLVEYAARSAKEHGILSEIPVDIFNGIDTLMLLRGSEKLAMDLFMCPDKIKEACNKIIGYWKYWVNELLKIQNNHVAGNGTTWLNLWGPDKTFCIQSDFMTMISAEMYEEFILPDIKFMCKELDNVIFHFDGPDEIIRHLDFLLDIPELGGIQWNPETNCENVRHLPTLKKIQESGKCLILNIAAHEIDDLLKELSPKGLLLNIDPFDEPYPNPEKADEIIAKAKKKR